MLKKILRFLAISLLMLPAGYVLAAEITDNGACTPVDYKERAAQCIAQAQTAYQKATEDIERGSRSIPWQPSLFRRSFCFPSGRLAELAVAVRTMYRADGIRTAADCALTTCRTWHNNTQDSDAARDACDQAMQNLRELTQEY